MEQYNKIMQSVWNRSSEHLSKGVIDLDRIRFDDLMASIFCPGPNYYFIFDFFDQKIKYIHPNVETVLGFDPETVTFKDIINQIHPDDIKFISLAEKAVINYLYNVIGRDKLMKYKASYCLRIKTADGNYQLSQHQSILLSTDEKGNFGKALNVLTNISHLTSVNNYKVTLLGMFGETNFVEFDILPNNHPTSLSYFTKRETEIIHLMTQGLKNLQIAEKLFISLNTVKNHRKNILQKASVKSSSELIAKCLNQGLI